MKSLPLYMFASISTSSMGVSNAVIAGYPNCDIPTAELLNNGKCDTAGVYVNNAAGIYWQPYEPNVEECGFDGGDCLERNEKYGEFLSTYPECKVEDDFVRVGNGACDLGEDGNGVYNEGSGIYYNSAECGFDGGDCDSFNAMYPDCPSPGKWDDKEGTILVGDGVCDRPWHLVNSASCGFEGGDCVKWNELYPECDVGNLGENFRQIGDGVCQPFAKWTTGKCGYDGGDCGDFFVQYPKCKDVLDEVYAEGVDVDAYERFGRGIDDSDDRCIMTSPFNVEDCGFHNGLCQELNKKKPACLALLLNAGQTFAKENFVKEKGSENGEHDQDSFNFGAELDIFELGADQLGDGTCNPGLLNSPECNFDGGDCTKFNKKYPSCNKGNLVPILQVGRDRCTTEAEECGYGDCDWNSCGDECNAGGVVTPAFFLAFSLTGIAGLVVAFIL